jgi:hypothetical protein
MRIANRQIEILRAQDEEEQTSDLRVQGIERGLRLRSQQFTQATHPVPAESMSTRQQFAINMETRTMVGKHGNTGPTSSITKSFWEFDLLACSWQPEYR